jgi:hypothetical protein
MIWTDAITRSGNLHRRTFNTHLKGQQLARTD